MFQFYLSSIKSERCFGSGLQIFCFNSTLVQLKVCQQVAGGVRVQRFNSTLVQLKGYY